MHESAGKIGHGTGCGDATTSGEPKRYRQDQLRRASRCSSPFHLKAELAKSGGLPLLAQKLVSAKRHRSVVGNDPLDTVLLHKSTELREPRKSFTFIHVDGINVSSTCLVAHVAAIVTVNVSSSRCQDGGSPPRSYRGLRRP